MEGFWIIVIAALVSEYISRKTNERLDKEKEKSPLE
jgi:hypothetical protein